MSEQYVMRITIGRDTERPGLTSMVDTGTGWVDEETFIKCAVVALGSVMHCLNEAIASHGGTQHDYQDLGEKVLQRTLKTLRRGVKSEGTSIIEARQIDPPVA